MHHLQKDVVCHLQRSYSWPRSYSANVFHPSWSTLDIEATLHIVLLYVHVHLFPYTMYTGYSDMYSGPCILRPPVPGKPYLNSKIIPPTTKYNMVSQQSRTGDGWWIQVMDLVMDSVAVKHRSLFWSALSSPKRASLMDMVSQMLKIGLTRCKPFSFVLC